MITVFGSINLDFLISVSRFAKTGETVAGNGFEIRPGGKGANQALAARRCGASVSFVGAVGPDDYAVESTSALNQAGVSLESLQEVEEPTGVAFVTIDPAGNNQIVVVPGANSCIRPDALVLDQGDLLLVQLEVPMNAVIEAATLASRAGARVILNAAPAAILPSLLLQMVDFLIVNEEEIAFLCEHEASAAARALRLSAEHDLVVVCTLGAAGALLANQGRLVRVEAPQIEVVDTVGAGDATIGAFAAALSSGHSLQHCLQMAVAYGSAVCTVAGAQTQPCPAEIEKLRGQASWATAMEAAS